MKLSLIGKVGVTMAALATWVHSYEFSSAMTSPIDDSNSSTGLTSNQESRIYGGTEADVSQYPFIASLRFRPDGKTFCGGTLVAPQYILTAGHCIKTDKGQIYVSLGSEYSSGPGSASAKKIKVAAGFLHPLYFNDKHRYDIGLLKLETLSTQKPAKLCASNGSQNKVGTLATVLGWGVTEKGKGSFTLKEVNVGVISNAECNKVYDNRITEEMMCAGNGNGKDSCNGDSGGPLVANDALIGLVSWGGQCGVNAGVYTRLAHVMDYIEDVLNGDTGSVFPKHSLMSGAAKKKKLTPSPETRSSEEPDKARTVATDDVAAKAVTGDTGPRLSSGLSSVSEESMLQTTMAKNSTASDFTAPTSQLSTMGEKTDSSNKDTASGKGCTVRRRRL